jgi:hypothetical protein
MFIYPLEIYSYINFDQEHFRSSVPGVFVLHYMVGLSVLGILHG